jgi:crotonobetainyl-CoA:carnitine CoA-transferase CaiB-like acyl-CoA transferase
MTPPSEAPDTRPLAGVKVVEFCQIASGPFTGLLLADYGAQVLKIEPPEGDAMRTWPPLSGGYSENFASLNRGKRSIALDLKQPADLAVARQLALEADVLVENSRPGAMQRLGLGWDWFQPRKPSLVYCSISAFGQDGPRGSEGGFDVTIQAAAGVMSVTGEPEGAPVKAGVPLADFASGLYHRGGAGAGAGRRCRRAHRRAHVRRHPGHLGPADQRVLRHRAQPAQAGLGPPA